MPRSVLVGWTAFLSSAAITTMLNLDSHALARYGSLVIEGGLLYAVVWSIAEDHRKATRIQLAIVVATTVVAATTLAVAALGTSYGAVLHALVGLGAQAPNDIRFGLARQEGSFPAPLFFAAWLVGASMLALVWLEDERPAARLLAWACWAALTTATVFTVSRVGVVVSFGGAGVFFLARRRPVKAVPMLMAAAVAGLLMARLTFPSFLPDSHAPGAGANTGESGGTSSAATPQPAEQVALEGSLSLREDAIRALWPAIDGKPLFGWGLLSAQTVISRETGQPNYIDDTYVQWLVELGLVGFGSFMFLVIAILVKGSGSEGTPEQISRILAMLALLGMCALASFLSITQGYAAFFLVAALLTASPVSTRPIISARMLRLHPPDRSSDQRARAASDGVSPRRVGSTATDGASPSWR